ncbi:retrotransposon protein, putative, ty1-copia subclass [Tanacetum coccineum]
MKKKKLCQGVSTLGIFIIELYSFPHKSWVYDTGCGTRIFNTTQGLRGSRKLKEGALNMYMGNGHHAVIEAIGIFHLCLSSGLVLVLNNCHYAPSITRGIFSVSCLYDDGFVIHSTLLWHYRLGHINKKRIKKLQHDGLLKSTDDESFDKCVSCLYGKMECKPYIHQVERAKDLLGLIHADSATRILNMVPTKKVEKTPYEVWHGQAPKVSYLKVWGCEALIKRDTLIKPDKLEPRFIKCFFVGYPKETIGYSFYYPPENKVLVARNAEFFENSLITQEASGSLEDLEVIQDEDTHPSKNTILHHDEDDHEINEPQSDIAPIRRSTRIRNTPDHMCLYIDAEEHELADHNEPTNYKAALSDPESKNGLKL